MNPKQKAVQAFKRLKNKFEPRRVIYRAYAGDGAGNVDVSGRPNYIWVRIVGKTDMLAQAYCRAIIASTGMNIFVEGTIVNGKPSYKVLEERPDDLGHFEDGDRWENVGSPAPEHHTAHEENGPDMINVAKAMVEPLRALPTDPASMKVTVTRDLSIMIGENINLVYPDRDTAYVESALFTAPAFGFRNDLLSIDSTGVQTITQGTMGWVADFPACPVGEIPIAYIRLTSSTTEILAENILDARPFITVPPDYAIFVHVAGDTMTGPLYINCNSAVALHVEQAGVHDDTLVVDTANGRVAVGALVPAYDFSIGSADGSDQVGIYHDNTNVHFTTTDGEFVFQTDEGVNTTTVLSLKGKGTGSGAFRIYDTAAALSMQITYAQIFRANGTLRFQTGADQDISMFSGATSGENPYFYIYGYDTGASAKKYGRFNIDADGDFNIEAQSGEVIRLMTGGADRVTVDNNGHLYIHGRNELRFYDNGNYVGFEAPVLAADQIWVLPDADGNAYDVMMTDGAGALTWKAVLEGVTGRVTYDASGVHIDSRALVQDAEPGTTWKGLIWVDTDTGGQEIVCFEDHVITHHDDVVYV